MSIYPQAIALTREACKQYRAGTLSEEVLQYRLMTAASLIVGLEEKKTRYFLEKAEADIELAIYASPRTSERVLEIIDGVEKELKKWEDMSK